MGQFLASAKESKKGEVAEGLWKELPKKVIVLYAKPLSLLELYPSTAGHVKPCRNLGEPSSKAK